MRATSSSRLPAWATTLAASLALAMAVTVCTAVTGTGSDDGERADATDPGDDDVADTASATQGPTPPRIRLREGTPLAQADDPTPVVTGTPLDQADIDAITGRLDPLAEDEGDRQDVALPAQTLPPPVAGETLPATFPPAGGDQSPPADTPTGPLEVLRVQPEGDVDIAPSLSVTFSQPMVPLTTLDQLDDLDVPVTVDPPVEGRWRWIGTRTLRLEHTGEGIDRLPMATDFTVTIPAGTTSTTGGALAEDVTFSFSTPPPTAQVLEPVSDSMPTDPVIVIRFDQRIDPDAVLDHLTLDADGRRDLRLATTAEVDADDDARRLAEASLEGRWLAVTPVEPLPTDTPLTLTVGEGTPSAEGPRTTTRDQTVRGRTYPPLRVIEVFCGGGDGCRPDRPWSIQMSNPLDMTAFDPAAITIEPALPGAVITAYDHEIAIQGRAEAGTTYRVTLPAELTDVRGQTLGEPDTRELAVGDPLPYLRRPDTDLVTLDPHATVPTFSMVSAGHDELRVVLLDVDVDDWPAYLRSDRHGDRIAIPDHPIIRDEVIDTGAEAGDATETIIDLAEAFPDGHGHALLYVESTREFPQNTEEYWQNRPVLVWLQATTIGVDAFADGRRMLVWTTDLRDGTPIGGATVTLDDTTATTGPDGLASIDLDSSGAPAVTATLDGQTALLSGGWEQRWQAQPQGDTVRWWTMDARGLHRPGETLELKGWVRRLTLSDDARLALLADGASVEYQVYDGQYTEIGSGSVPLNALGGFDLAVEIPAGANLGQGGVSLQLSGVPGLDGHGWEHPLRIEEFRRPEFEVATQATSPGPHAVTAPVTVSAEATYFAGGGLPNAPVTWTVTQAETSYRPPGWDAFSFGVFVPWWYGGYGFEGGRGFIDEACCFPGGEQTVERLSGTTDAAGRHLLEIDFEVDEDGLPPDQPIQVSANAAVEDVNRQAFAGTTDLLVHSGRRYLGLRSDRAFVRQGDPLRVDAVLVDVDGAAVADQPVTLTAARLVTELVNGELVEQEVDPQACELTSATEPQRCEFTPDVGGRYRVSGTVTDPDGGVTRTELEVWVAGAEEVPTRRVTQEQLTLIPAQQEWAVGDVAEVLVPAPFSPATGLATLTRSGIIQTLPVTVTDGSAVLEVPITADMVGEVEVRVDLVGQAPRLRDDGSTDPDLPPRPAYAAGQVRLVVPPTAQTLTVDAVPAAAAVEPGDRTSVEVAVTDASGAPVEGADVAVVVVDEALLSLVGRMLEDPAEVFHSPFGSWLDVEQVRRTLLLSRSDVLAGDRQSGGDDAAGGGLDTVEDTMAEGEATEESAADDGDAASGAATAAAAPAPLAADEGGRVVAQGPDGTPIEVRSDFDALAVFAPSLSTGADGRTRVDVDVPDSLTRYRIIAVAASGADRFGKGESTLTARLPLQVRPSAPRFANFGDTFELPVVLQNATDADLEADVVLEATNLATGIDQPVREDLDGSAPVGQRVTVPAGDRVEVRFPVATIDAGTARFRATAVASTSTGDAADSATVSLPVWTPATTESFATYGVIDAGAVAQPLATPEGVIPSYGGLEVTTSTTALQALTDAVLYLEEYRYSSSDAHASRLMAIAALRDVLAAFDAEQLPAPEAIEATAAADVESLVGLQNSDGGWSVWERGRPTEAHHSIQATHALVVARDAGYTVPQGTLDLALERLRSIESVIDPQASPQARESLRAYAIHVRALAGDRDPARAAEVHAALGDLAEDTQPLDALAWLWPVLDDPARVEAIGLTLANQVTETPSAATFTTGYDEGAHLTLASDRRTDGIVLDALLTMRPDDELVPKVVNGLIGNQKQGRWGNVQENSFILLALKRYFDTFESVTPDLVARVWLGESYAAEHPHQGRSVDSTLTVVPTDALLERDDPTLVLSRDGEGRLYYRLGLRTAPDDLRLDPRDEGFVVDRTYEAVGDPADVTRDADGTWRIAAGAEVRITLTMVADSRRVNMALVDPLPAGLEAVNPALAAAPALPPQPDPTPSPGAPEDGCCEIHDSRIWQPTWFDHQNLRDDRVEAFSGWLPAGTYTYTTIARATTPGTFVVPPARAEEIYTPEVFGRSATDTVVVTG